MRDEKCGGFVLLLTFAVMAVLITISAALCVMITHEMRHESARVEDTQLLYLAEAGAARAMRELRDDYRSTTQTGTAYLRGSDTSASISIGSTGEMRYLAGGTATINNASDQAIIFSFDSNVANTKIISVSLITVASRNTAQVRLSYTAAGDFSDTTTSGVFTLTGSLAEYEVDVTADRTWTWETLMSSNFRVRLQRISGGNINIDLLCVKVRYDIDTLTEPWSTGSYQALPLSLGEGSVQTISIIDEQGKVHLNTATQALLRYLMVENGIADATANTVATNIVSTRSTNPFDSMEELHLVTGMTDTIYNAIDQDVTVYSFISPYASDPAGSRAPINVNTASREVLLAALAPLTFSLASDRTSFVDAIISTRATAPFTCFFSGSASVTTDFFDFVRSGSFGYLSNAEDDRILGNADASSLLPSREGGSAQSCLTAEFCYDSPAFLVTSRARVLSRDFELKTVIGDRSNVFTTDAADTTSVGFRKETFV